MSNVNFHMAKGATVVVLRESAAAAPITECNLAAGDNKLIVQESI